MGGVPDERLVDEGIVIVHYDLPVPRRRLINNNDISNDNELRRLMARWRTWYDWATGLLRKMGYPIGYSVVLTDARRLKEVYDASERVKKRYLKLKGLDKWSILPDENRIKIGIVRFRPATDEDFKALEVMFRDYLRESLETIKDYIIKKLKVERKDPKDVNRRVREMLKRLKEQDRFKLLERDEELRKLLALIDILTAEA